MSGTRIYPGSKGLLSFSFVQPASEGGLVLAPPDSELVCFAAKDVEKPDVQCLHVL